MAMREIEPQRAVSNHISSHTFQNKKTNTVRLLKQVMSRAKRPVILSSFGKESLVLMELAREHSLQSELAYFELGVVREKHTFARRTIGNLGLLVTDLIPHSTSLIRGLTDTSLAYTFKLDSGAEFHVAITFEEGPEDNLACGLDPSVQRHGNHSPYPWDVLISGRRDSDVDVSLGSLHWHSAVQYLNGATAIVMPLLNWSNEDVYHYLCWRKIEPDMIRYERIGYSFRSRTDLRNNPDHAPCCIRCLSAVRGTKVNCPKLKTTIVSFCGIPEDPTIVPNNVSPAVMC